jgi:tetratricopeptide (TPR) repeat protein
VIPPPPRPAIASLLLSTLFLGAPGGSLAGTEKEFEESLQVVDRTIASGKGKKAKELLLATIDASQGQPFALYHLTEIEDDLSRATFWSSNERPDPKTLVSGELLSWSPANGQIKLRYRLGSEAEKPSGKSKGTGTEHGTWAQILGDFTKQGAAWVHPLAFDGPFTIEIKGSAYPTISDPPRVPLIAVCASWNESTIVSFGLAPARVDKNVRYVPARILHVEGGESTTLAEEQMNVLPGQPYDVKVVVAASSVTGFLNENKLVTAARSGSLDGRFAFENFPNVSEILVTGKAQPSWLSNVVDTAVQERWSAFEKGYKSVDDLPTWLREKALGSGDVGKRSEDVIPGEDTFKGKERASAFMDMMRAGKRQEALDFAGKIPVTEVSEETRAWLEAFALSAMGREREALAAYEKVCALDPNFLPARRMKVVLERVQRSLREAIEDAKRVVTDFPKESGPYVDLANLHLLEGRPEDAQALVRSAIDSGIPAGTLEEAQHLVTRALRGPLWSKSYEYKSEHYTVSSDINQRICFEAATLLEKFYTKFNLHLRHVPPQEKRVFRVFLFSGRAGYDAYTRDLIGQEKKNTAGLYSGLVKQLLIWNLPDFENMMRTVRHEGFHQYLDRLTSAAPVWLNEGLAEYYEGSKLVKGAWSDGEIQGQHLETLAKQGLVPLQEFVHVRPSTFYSEKFVHVSYAQAWAFVHFLLSSGPENKKVFDQLLDLLLAGTKQADAIDQVFTNATLPRLEQEFASYVRRLK